MSLKNGKLYTMTKREAKLFTIGSSGKTAEAFFEALKASGVKRLLDVRLGGTRQLAGFAKRGPGSLDYLARIICGASYVHMPDLAPGQSHHPTSLPLARTRSMKS
jgi:hypothetical protein